MEIRPNATRARSRSGHVRSRSDCKAKRLQKTRRNDATHSRRAAQTNLPDTLRATFARRARHPAHECGDDAAMQQTTGSQAMRVDAARAPCLEAGGRGQASAAQVCSGAARADANRPQKGPGSDALAIARATHPARPARSHRRTIHTEDAVNRRAPGGAHGRIQKGARMPPEGKLNHDGSIGSL